MFVSNSFKTQNECAKALAGRQRVSLPARAPVRVEEKGCAGDTVFRVCKAAALCYLVCTRPFHMLPQTAVHWGSPSGAPALLQRGLG